MRKLIVAFFTLLLPALLFAQTDPEPKECPWGCPTLLMRGNAIYLSMDAKSVLQTIAGEMRKRKDCNVTVFTYSDTGRLSQITSQRRMDAIKQFFADKRIASDRLVFTNKQDANKVNTIDIRSECNFNSPNPANSVKCPCNYPDIFYKTSTLVTLDSTAKASLSTTASRLKENPSCEIIIHAYAETSKVGQAVSQKRLDAIKRYLVEKENISADRIMTSGEFSNENMNRILTKCMDD